MKTIYLATPYSFKSKIPLLGRLIMWCRCRTVTKVAAILMGEGHNVFSPITHSHHIARIGKLPQLDHEFWLRMDKWYVDRCDQVYVLNVVGWSKSVGVQREIEWAKEQNKSVYFINKKGLVIRQL